MPETRSKNRYRPMRLWTPVPTKRVGRSRRYRRIPAVWTLWSTPKIGTSLRIFWSMGMRNAAAAVWRQDRTSLLRRKLAKSSFFLILKRRYKLTHKEILEIAAETKLPVAYDHFAEGESPEPPFLVFRYPSADNFAADGTAYFKMSRLDFELYTDKKSTDTEATIEAVLDSHGIFYAKSEVWIPSEKLYEVLYQMEV